MGSPSSVPQASEHLPLHCPLSLTAYPPQDSISVLKGRLAAHLRDSEERNRRLREEKEVVLKQLQKLKSQMSQARAQARSNLAKLTLDSSAALKELNRVEKKVRVEATLPQDRPPRALTPLSAHSTWHSLGGQGQYSPKWSRWFCPSRLDSSGPRQALPSGPLKPPPAGAAAPKPAPIPRLHASCDWLRCAASWRRKKRRCCPSTPPC